MYTFPDAVSDELLRVMAEQDQVLPYLDIPLQHAHPDVLKRMHRPADIDVVRQTIKKVAQNGSWRGLAHHIHSWFSG